MFDDLWYRNAVIYALDVASFMDANGDGVGDFEGLMRRLDYLESLGVDALWLGPFQTTPNRDNGYDIADFYNVDARYGTTGDFVEFMHQANGRGIRVLIDLVVNHTSNEHPWFQDARSGPDARHRDWYVWSKQRPADWNKGMVFPGVQDATWTRDKEAKAWYYHRFYDFQPDLNIENSEVRTEIRRIMGFWLQLGVSGFRIDAVPFIIEPRPTPGRKKPLRFDVLQEMRRFLEWRTAGAIMLGEANVLPKENEKYFGDEGDGIHMMFNFFVNQHAFYTLASGEVEPLAKALLATRELPAGAQWGQFLRNHDELDLGRLTERQRAVVFERFGPEPTMQLYGRGIRRRLAPMLGDRAQIEVAYSLLFALPGTPVIRYGDEIGMGDDLSLKERESVRTPMQWANEPNGGFTLAERAKSPVIDHGPYGYREINVERQRRDPQSLLNWTVRMIRIRKECPEIGWGTWELLSTRSPHVLGICYQWRGNSVVVLHNFANRPVEARFRVKASGGDRLVNLLEVDEVRADAKGVHHVSLEAMGYRWYRVGGLGYALQGTRDSREGRGW